MSTNPCQRSCETCPCHSDKASCKISVPSGRSRLLLHQTQQIKLQIVMILHSNKGLWSTLSGPPYNTTLYSCWVTIIPDFIYNQPLSKRDFTTFSVETDCEWNSTLLRNSNRQYFKMCHKFIPHITTAIINDRDVHIDSYTQWHKLRESTLPLSRHT